MCCAKNVDNFDDVLTQFVRYFKQRQKAHSTNSKKLKNVP